MECKWAISLLPREKMEELIDTLWNVNIVAFWFAWLAASELIDTLWNVNNNYELDEIGTDSRINRYIVECKYKIGAEKTYKKIELIDTLWNVNVNPQPLYPHQGKELIDTLWNVNQ